MKSGTGTHIPVHTTRRGDKRDVANRSAVLHVRGQQFPVVLQDVSAAGLRVRLYEARAKTKLPRSLQIEVPGLGLVPISGRWRHGAEFGATFAVSEARKALLATQIARLIGTRT